jgi:hypothetical protein
MFTPTISTLNAPFLWQATKKLPYHVKYLSESRNTKPLNYFISPFSRFGPLSIWPYQQFDAILLLLLALFCFPEYNNGCYPLFFIYHLCIALGFCDPTYFVKSMYDAMSG